MVFEFTPNNFNKVLAKILINLIAGWNMVDNIFNVGAAKNEIFSGFSAASVFGVTSANIRITTVSIKVAAKIPPSPQKRMAITVAMAEARILTILLPSKMSPNNLSGLFNIS